MTERQRLHDRLDAFLNKEEGDGYGWPDISREDLSEIYGIIGDIADQKWKRDCDGDQVFAFAVSNRKRGRLVYAVVPHDPGTGSRREGFESEAAEEAAWRQWFYDGTRAAHLLIAQGSEVLRLIPEYMSMRNKKDVV